MHWTKDPRAVFISGEAGDCRRTVTGHGIKHADITILTTAPANSAVPLNDAFIHWVAMHEIGHALGISAHSSNAKDIMFSTVTFDVDSKDISSRDLTTLKRMYESTTPNEVSKIDLYNEAVNEIAKQNRLPRESQDFLPGNSHARKNQKFVSKVSRHPGPTRLLILHTSEQLAQHLKIEGG